MDKGDYLTPRLVALAKDSCLQIYFDYIDPAITYNYLCESLINDVDISNRVKIKKEFSSTSNKNLVLSIENSYKIITSAIVNTLKFVGRPNDSHIEEIKFFS